VLRIEGGVIKKFGLAFCHAGSAIKHNELSETLPFQDLVPTDGVKAERERGRDRTWQDFLT
jgi:hypothetical protein